MKYLKYYEGPVMDEYNRKSAEYKKYADKYIVFESHTDDYNGIFLGQFINIVLNGYFAKIHIYGRYKYDAKNVFHLSDFKILEVFDNVEDAKTSYKLLKKANKYNL